ncbi:unnamed protein product [Schistocephalus solidus]|uniref:JmjC domain-containing protein n=1 Tax=Schistocephalus solidus TaxID=70667 RepID=A0A183S7X9_SCHSO|nr:unnamed protein product [Schistocephalus solidus]
MVHHIATKLLCSSLHPADSLLARLTAGKPEFDHMLQPWVVGRKSYPWGSLLKEMSQTITCYCRSADEHRALKNTHVATPSNLVICQPLVRGGKAAAVGTHFDHLV